MSERFIKVLIHHSQEDAFSSSCLAEFADRALSALAVPTFATVEVVITDDKTIRELNLHHRGLDETTDVLSFSMATGDAGCFILPPTAERDHSIGEVVLSGPQTIRQAAQNGRDSQDEAAFLIAHGILHLMGHDHEEAKERSKMESEHSRLLVTMLGPQAAKIEVKYPS